MLLFNIGMMISAVINLHAFNTANVSAVVNENCNGSQTWVQDRTVDRGALIAGSSEESMEIQLT